MPGLINLSSPINWAAPLNRDLVHSWSSSGGSQLRDIANRSVVSIVGAAWDSQSFIGGRGSLLFNGSSSYYSANIDSTPVAWNLSAWIKASSETVAHLSASGNFGIYVRIGRNSGFRNSSGSFFEVNTATGSGVSSGWYHIALDYDGSSTLRFYRDGQIVLTNSSASGVVDRLSLAEIGRLNAASGQYWGDRISDVEFRAVSLGDAGMDRLYRAAVRGYPNERNYIKRRRGFSAGGGGVTVTPGAASVTLSTFAPAVLTPRLCTPAVASLATTAYAPTVSTPRLATPATATLTTTAFAPTVSTPRLVTPGTLALSLTAFAPTVSAPRVCTPGTLALTTTAFAPTVSVSDASAIVPGTATLTITTYAPTVSAPRLVTPPTATLTLATFAPTVAAPRLVTPPTASLTTTKFAPTVSTPRLVTPGTLALVLNPFAPVVSAPRVVVPGTRALVLTSYAPTVSTGVVSTKFPGAVTFSRGGTGGTFVRSLTGGTLTRRI